METKLADPKDIECAIRNILSYIGENDLLALRIVF